MRKVLTGEKDENEQETEEKDCLAVCLTHMKKSVLDTMSMKVQDLASYTKTKMRLSGV